MSECQTKLVVCIVHSDDASELQRALSREDFESTLISSTGGFLRRGNATILIGLEAWRLEHALAIICRVSHTHLEHLPTPAEGMAQVGAAIVFVLDVEQYTRV